MKNVADILVQRTIDKKSPIVVGLDPSIDKIPLIFKQGKQGLEGTAQALLEFCRAVIDAVQEHAPAVKPQTAFFEMYGSYGMKALEDAVQYARQKGLVVIEDAKRNDIGNTAMAYARGHLGRVELASGDLQPALDVDFLTVSPFLGPESLQPFFEVAQDNEKGLFVLAKTSNSGSGMIQDVQTSGGATISEEIARLVHQHAAARAGESGYSPIGAVVGATYPAQAETLRTLMPNSILLVPGYGAQGGGAQDILPCFNPDGLGAIVNASRSINYAYAEKRGPGCTAREFRQATEAAVVRMREEIYQVLKDYRSAMVY